MSIKRGHQSENLLSDFAMEKFFILIHCAAHSMALQIFFYYDDVEVCNPFGSKAKLHKLSKQYKIIIITLYTNSGNH